MKGESLRDLVAVLTYTMLVTGSVRYNMSVVLFINVLASASQYEISDDNHYCIHREEKSHSN